MRLFLVLGLVAATLISTVGWGVDIADSCNFNLFPEQRQRSTQLDQLRLQRDDFEPRLQAILGDVAEGRRSLASGCEAIECSATEHFPGFLKYVNAVESGRDLRANIATLIVRNLTRPSQDVGCVDSDRAAELHHELAALVGQTETAR